MLEITMNMSFILFTIVSLYLLKVKNYTYYNNGVIGFFSFYFLVNSYMAIVNYATSGVILSAIEAVAKFGVIVLFYALLYIRSNVLIRYKRMYLEH